LKCLDRKWQPKVTIILETRYLTTLAITVLYDKLREHDLEMNRLKEKENKDRKVTGLTLKSAAQNEDNSEKCSSDCSDAEILNMFTRRFNKFLKKRGKEKNQKAKKIQ